MSAPCRYDHTQVGKLHWLLWLWAVGFVVVAGILGEAESTRKEPVWVIFLAAAGLLVLCGGWVRQLRVWDAGDALMVRFGPLPFFGLRIPYADVREVTTDRSTFMDGWGIHYMPGKGWIYNIWGYDCVRVKVGEKTVRIGTDDPAGLTEFLRSASGLTR